MTKNILLIEDDMLTRKGLSNGLASSGHDFNISEAANGKEGLDKALHDHPDLIVTDLRMPEMDGITMVEELRKDDWGKTVPVIVMTADDSTENLNKALASGVTTYLEKSTLVPDMLADSIAEALDN